MAKLKELTLELTDYCPHDCDFCSSNAGSGRDKGNHLDLVLAQKIIANTDAKIIHLSGGEPLLYPWFWQVLRLAQMKVGARNVRVMTNAFQWIAYNTSVIDGIRIDANMPAQTVDRVNVLKRVSQGRERDVPAVHFSRNHDGKCSGDCGHRVVRVDGTIAKSPCRKDKEPRDAKKGRQ